jgi:2-polyprenyl-6-methoxyphenol hydroxylase-like FAD-dependent oxidoreductase
MERVQHIGCDVLVVGAGPVGLSLARALGIRGVDVLVAERRFPDEPVSIKANHVSARTMEIFRRLGLADAIREAGLPADYPHDVAFRATTTGVEFARTVIPSRVGRRSGEVVGPDTSWPTPEPAHRINQSYLEPVLLAHAEATSTVRVVHALEIESIEQADDEVQATGRRLDDGTAVRVSCRYLVGCDGGSSLVRKSIGGRLGGTPEVSRWQSTFISAPGLLGALTNPPAWMTLSVNPRRSGTVIAVDGAEKWLIHYRLEGDESGLENEDRDRAVRSILGVDDGFEYEIVRTEDWVGRRLVADRFHDRRVFLCGDAAHLWVPFSGYGMNAGIADAEDLAWMIVARAHGWGGSGLLDAYAAERAPITEQVSHFAADLSIESARMDADVPAEIEQPGADGDLVRAEFGERARTLSLHRHTAGGLNFGYFYDRSPIIAYDDGSPPPYDAHNFVQSTAPGCRTPHVWLADGRSLYDELGEGFSVVRSDPGISSAALQSAAADRGVPLRVVDIAGTDGASVYDHALVVSRPDAHIAWRGDAEPDDPGGLIDLIRGHSGHPKEVCS